MEVINNITKSITDLVGTLKTMDVMGAINHLVGMIPKVDAVPYANILIPAAVALVSIILAFYGKKLLNLLRLVVCAGGCYYLGAVILWPFVEEYLAPHGVTDIIAGVVLAVIGALISSYAYALVFAGALGYVTYLLVPVFGAVDDTKHILIAVGVGVAALLFRGLFETVLTSVIGGAGFSLGLYAAICNLANFKLQSTTPVLGPLTFESVVLVVVGVLLCLSGYLHQVKNRHRY